MVELILAFVNDFLDCIRNQSVTKKKNTLHCKYIVIYKIGCPNLKEREKKTRQISKIS